MKKQKRNLDVTLGSTSPQKLKAVLEAFERLAIQITLSTVKTSSGQNAQPVGWDETYAGAFTRATSARKKNPKGIAIGIENGIFRSSINPPTTLDMAIIVVLTKDGRRIVTTSQGIQFPEDCVITAEKHGFKETTVGSVIAEKCNGDPADPHSLLTKGRLTRASILAEGITNALRQL